MIRIQTQTKFGDGTLVGIERFKDKGMTSYVDESWGSLEEVSAWLAGDMGEYPNRMIVELDDPIPDGLFMVLNENRLAFYRHDVVNVWEEV